MIPIKQRVREILTPIKDELFETILWYNGTLESCGYAASIITKLLQGELPSDQVRIGYGYKGSEYNLRYHYWTEVNDQVFVDATYGQYDPRRSRAILIEDLASMSEFDLTRFDRKKPEEFSPIIVEYCGRRTIEGLITKPDEPFIPGFQFIWGQNKRDYTLQAIERLEAKLEAPRFSFKAVLQWLRGI